MGLVALADNAAVRDVFNAACHDVAARGERLVVEVFVRSDKTLELDRLSVILHHVLGAVSVPEGVVIVFDLDDGRVNVKRQRVLNVIVNDLAVAVLVGDLCAAAERPYRLVHRHLIRAERDTVEHDHVGVADLVYDKASDTNKKIHLFWLGVGTDDFLYGNARDYMQFLDDKGIHSVKEFTTDKFGHTWMNAKHFLAKTLPLLFNKKAAEAAMKEAQPTPAATGKEQQFTPGVMARLFPRPIISPEYTPEGIIFRFKATEAKKVELFCEMLPDYVTMERDSDGVWSTTLKDYVFETFKYCFIVDGLPVCDPSNMYLSPDNGFKYSIADNPHSPFNFASQGEIEHGRVAYDLERMEAWYTSVMPRTMTIPTFIQLVPGKDDTMESWFKIGGADAIADRLIADKKTKPCIITTSPLEFMQGGQQMPGFKVRTLRADDYPTWTQRRRALVKMLLEIGREQAPQFPGFGGGRPGGFGGGRRFGGGGFGGGPQF